MKELRYFLWILALLFVFFIIINLFSNNIRDISSKYNKVDSDKTLKKEKVVQSTDTVEEISSDEGFQENLEELRETEKEQYYTDTDDKQSMEGLPTLKSEFNWNIENVKCSLNGKYYTDEAFAQEKNLKTYLPCQESPNWTDDCKNGKLFGDLCVVKLPQSDKFVNNSYGLDRIRDNYHKKLIDDCDSIGMRLPTVEEIGILEKNYETLLAPSETTEFIACETKFYKNENPSDNCIGVPLLRISTSRNSKVYKYKMIRRIGYNNNAICVKRIGPAGAKNIRKESFPELPQLVCPNSLKRTKVPCKISAEDKNLCYLEIKLPYNFEELYKRAKVQLITKSYYSGYYDLLLEPLECKCREYGMHLGFNEELSLFWHVFKTDIPYLISNDGSRSIYYSNINSANKNDLKKLPLRIICVKRLDER